MLYTKMACELVTNDFKLPRQRCLLKAKPPQHGRNNISLLEVIYIYRVHLDYTVSHIHVYSVKLYNTVEKFFFYEAMRNECE